MKKIILFCLCAFWGSASASIITMEVGDRYVDHGFQFTSGFVDDLFANPYNGTSGYDTVLTSGDYVAYQYNDNVEILLLNGGVWDFTGAFWASAWDTTNTLTLQGYNGANLLFTTSDIIFRNTKQWIQSNFTGITNLKIQSSGSQVALDNFTYNKSNQIPEPTSLWLLSLGLAGFGFSRKKKA